jgi:hypothetical protein
MRQNGAALCCTPKEVIVVAHHNEKTPALVLRFPSGQIMRIELPLSQLKAAVAQGGSAQQDSIIRIELPLSQLKTLL